MTRAPVSLAVVAALAACGDRDRPEPASADLDPAQLAARIAYVSDRDGALGIWMSPGAGADPIRVAGGAAATFPGLAAPSGDALIAIVSAGDDHGPRTEQLALIDLGGRALTPLGPAASKVRNPVWTPDGQAVVFESDAHSFRDLYRVDRGGAVTRLTDHEAGNFEPTLSPDGSRLAFVSSRDGDAEIYAMNADGTGLERLTAFHTDDLSPTWSPDGRQLAFVSDREGRDRIFAMRPDGSGQRRVTTETGAVDEGEPTWSPSADRIAYVVRGRGPAGVWVIPATGGAAIRLSPDDVVAEHPAWSPDGALVAFTGRRAGNTDIYIARADGSAVVRLTTEATDDWLPRWIPAPERSL